MGSEFTARLVVERALLLFPIHCHHPKVSKLALTGGSLTEVKHPTLASGIRFRKNSVGCLWIEHVFLSAYVNSNP